MSYLPNNQIIYFSRNFNNLQMQQTPKPLAQDPELVPPDKEN